MKYLVIVLFFSVSFGDITLPLPSKAFDCDTVCTDSCPGTYEAQTQTGQCVCHTSFVRNPLNGKCECPPNQVAQSQPCTSCNAIWYGTACVCPISQLKCVCQSPNVYDSVNNICCPPNEFFKKGCGCICKPPLQRNAATRACECPLNEVFISGKCVCKPPMVRDVSGVCCGQNEVFSKDCGQCICKKGFLYNSVSKKCECPYRETFTNGVCICPPNTTRNPVTGLCVPIIINPIPANSTA